MFPDQSDLKAIHKLGEGGYSETWRATQLLTDGQQRVVIVRYLPVVSSLDAFAREKEIYRRALRSNLNGVSHLLEVRRVGVGYLQIFEDNAGDTLRKHLRDGPLSVKAAVDVVSDVLKTLRTLNEWGVIHSDIKPSNLIWDASSSRVRLIDLTDAYKPGAYYLYEQYIGDKRYAPPERMQGWLDASSQVFMLGLVFWQLLTGTHPFQVSDEEPFLNMAQFRWGELNLSALADMPLWVQRIITYMLHPNAAQRPSIAQLEAYFKNPVSLPAPVDGRGQKPLPADEYAAQQQLSEAGVRYARFRIALDLDNEGRIEEAKRIYADLAREGYSRAQNNLGLILRNAGHHTQALALFKAAFLRANPYGAYNLARAYMSGQGVEKNEEIARHYFEWAARRGHRHAQLRLAELLRKKGATEEALYWQQLADAQEKEKEKTSA